MELSTINADVKEFVKQSNELIQLEDIEKTKKQLESIVEKHKGKKISLETYKEGKEARSEIRQFRYGLQNISKHNSKILNEAKRENKSLLDDLIAIIRPTEDEIDNQIKEVEEEKKRIKKEEELKEKKRIAEVGKLLQEYKSELNTILEYGQTKSDLEKFKKTFEDLKDDIENEKFEEFGFEANNLVDALTPKIDAFKHKIKQKEIDDLHRDRKNKLIDVWSFVSDQEMNFGEIDEKEFNEILKNSKKLKKEDELKKAEEERLRKQQEEEQERLRKEKAEKELRERKREEVRQKKIQEELEAEKRKLRAEREKFEKELAEAKKKKEEEERKKRIEQERIEKERKEKEMQRRKQEMLRKEKEERERKLKEERESLKKESSKYGIQISGKSNDEIKEAIQNEKDKIDEKRKKEIRTIGEKYLKEVRENFNDLNIYFNDQGDMPEIYHGVISDFERDLMRIEETLYKRLIEEI